MGDLQPDSSNPVSSIGPLAFDVLLTSSFDWRELANVLSDFGMKLSATCKVHGRALGVYQMIHAQCRKKPELGAYLVNRLNGIHQTAICRVQAMDSYEISECLNSISIKDRRKFSAFLWALLTDERHSVQRLANYLIHRYVMNALVVQSDERSSEFESIAQSFYATSAKV